MSVNSIRRAKRADVTALRALEQECFSGDRISDRAMLLWIDRPTGDLLVVPAETGIAGYTLVIYRRGCSFGRIYSLAVSPEFRGQGIAQKLLTACEKYAMKRNCRELRLEVSVRNRPAISLYERLGFVAFGTYPGYYDDGSDALRMSKRLAND